MWQDQHLIPGWRRRGKEKRSRGGKRRREEEARWEDTVHLKWGIQGKLLDSSQGCWRSWLVWKLSGPPHVTHGAPVLHTSPTLAHKVVMNRPLPRLSPSWGHTQRTLPQVTISYSDARTLSSPLSITPFWGLWPCPHKVVMIRKVCVCVSPHNGLIMGSNPRRRLNITHLWGYCLGPHKVDPKWLLPYSLLRSPSLVRPHPSPPPPEAPRWPAGGAEVLIRG